MTQLGPDSIKRIGVVGAGMIGASWAAYFNTRGIDYESVPRIDPPGYRNFNGLARRSALRRRADSYWHKPGRWRGVGESVEKGGVFITEVLHGPLGDELHAHPRTINHIDHAILDDRVPSASGNS